MGKYKYISDKLASAFKFNRMDYDPTQDKGVNCHWDETKSSSKNTDSNNVSASGKYKNHQLPLDFEEKVSRIKESLKLFDESLPNLKK